MNIEKVRRWERTLNNKTEQLRNSLGFTFVYSSLIFLAVYAVFEYKISDIPLIILLCISVISCIPYVPVARKKNNSSMFPDQLTIQNWRNELKHDKYDMLNTSLSFLQPVYPLITFINFSLFLAYKIDDTYISYDMMVFMLSAQVFFNPLFGYNPIGRLVVDMKVNSNIDQKDVLNFIDKRNSRQIENKQTLESISDNTYNQKIYLQKNNVPGVNMPGKSMNSRKLDTPEQMKQLLQMLNK